MQLPDSLWCPYCKTEMQRFPGRRFTCFNCGWTILVDDELLPLFPGCPESPAEELARKQIVRHLADIRFSDGSRSGARKPCLRRY